MSLSAGDARLIADGRRWTEAFYARQTQAFWDHLSPRFQKSFVDKKGVDDFRDEMEAQLGSETQILSEDVERSGDGLWYVRVAKFSRRAEPVRVRVAVEDDTILGFGIRPEGKPAAAPTTKLDYQTRAPLRLPFDGEWRVAWGGRTVEKNQHVVARDQRFAYDFVVEENGVTHRGDGTKNDDYYCYGRPILAPAEGRVAVVVDGIPENVPGRMDEKSLAGNYVMLDHGGDEVSLFAHLIPGSIPVRVGERVKPGQLLGRCGNSGNASEPHLHYQLQDSARFGDADGLPAQFRDYVADGKDIARGEPERGQAVHVNH